MMKSSPERARIVVLTTEGVVSYRILHDTLRNGRVDCLALVVLPSTGVGPRRTVVRRVLRRSGARMLIYKFVTQLISFSWASSRVAGTSERATPTELADRLGIPVIHATDCNAPGLVAALEDMAPHFLVSVNVYQRLQEPLLGVPSVAALNTHFGHLPQYKGMSPVIWAMANGERAIGITIHKMVLGFDEGEIVSQEVLETQPGESVLGATLRGAECAGRLLPEAIIGLADGRTHGRPQEGQGSYFSFPTRRTLADLRKQGRKLWRIRDLLSSVN